MTSSFAFADSRALHEPFCNQLRTCGPSAAFRWLTDILGHQEPGLRSSNASLVAYTGCTEAIDWIEVTVASPVTEHWGSAAALLGTPWPRLARWLRDAKATQLVALDALVAYRSPAPNMAPLAQIAAPVLPEPPAASVLEATLDATLQLRSTPRVRNSVNAIRRYSAEILRNSQPGVPVSDLPKLYLEPESFPHAGEVLSRAASVRAGITQSIDDMITKLKSN